MGAFTRYPSIINCRILQGRKKKKREREGGREREREGGKDDRIARIFIERQFKNPFSATGKLNLYYRHVTVEPILYENRAQYGANAPLK